MTKVYPVILALLCTGCGNPPAIYVQAAPGATVSETSCPGASAGQPGTCSTPSPQKGLFSVWTDLNGETLDLRSANFGTSKAILDLDDEPCGIDATISGTEESGTIVVAGSIYVGSLSDPGCASLNTTFSYANNIPKASLTICGAPISGGCDTYQ